MHNRSFPVVCVSVCLLITSGCLPESKAPEVEGPIESKVASQLQAKIRAKHGNKFSTPHKYKDQEFMANWELSNALKKSSQLQMKPPAEWKETDLYQALEVVLNDHETKPWYGAIDDTVLRLMRAALKDDNNLASGFAPETPYDVQVKVKHHSSEWFLEVKVQIVNEDGMALGF